MDGPRQWRGRLATFPLVLGFAVVTAQGQAPAPIVRPSAAEIAGGAKTYRAHCARCHGFDGSGGSGPPLARPRLRRAADEAGILVILEEGIAGTAMPAAWTLSQTEKQQVTAYVRSLSQQPEEALPGDPVRGRAVYARAGCPACHIVDGQGATVGPDLSDIGVLRGAAFLRESLLVPGAAQPERPVPYEPYGYPAYLVVRAQKQGGPEVLGVRVNEDTFTIQVRDREGRVHSFRKTELERLAYAPEVSLMPSVRGVLDEASVNDLVAWLMTRRGGR